MTKLKTTPVKWLGLLSALLVLVALALCVCSSAKAYRMSSLPMMIALAGAAAVLQLLATLFGHALPCVVVDLAHWGATALTSAALCGIIMGRVTLMGYVYFSDLESSNPVAIAAMNLAIAAWACYGLALVLTVIIGFTKRETD